MVVVQKQLTPEQPQSLPVLGIGVDILPDYSHWLASRIEQQQGTHVVTFNAEMAMQSRQNSDLADIIQGAELVIPDGAGVVLYSRLQGRKIKRCPGIELSEALLKRSVEGSQAPWSFFFYGGQPGVATQAAQAWQRRYPQIRILGTEHGYLSTEQRTDFLHRLETLQPQVIFVGLGVPRQESWITDHRHLCPKAIWVGIGGSLDIWAGTKTRAPEWFCNNHLEWLYRFYQEPWRWRRMLALPKFFWFSLIEKLS
ncbi:MAG: WecB/TagA/CpsF family glycosyltransferase [Acaryochloridaceae cyanobacterium SU_2_1]|nr:WecB/TagA/CpsF family glycosyltransferase [Acaryochloridaceae cyanobacterium SU_2_1]